MNQPPNRTPSAERNTALHEAGHAVVALAFGYRVKSVTIIPREVEGGWFVGSIDLDGQPSPRELRTCDRATAECYFIKQFAGAAAETLFSDDPCPLAWSHATDYEQGDVGYCREWMERFAQGDLEGYRREIRARTEAFLLPRRRNVEAVAEALQRRRQLDGAGIGHVLRASIVPRSKPLNP